MTALVDDLLSDLRFGLRTLLANRSFAITAIVTLAVGIGASTTIFSVVNTVLIRPLPFSESQRLVALWETSVETGRPDRVAAENYADWREQSERFVDMAMLGAVGFNLTGQGDPEQLLGGRVSANFFQLLGVEPILGRAFVPDDDLSGAANVVMLSHGVWQRRFGSRTDIIGQPITLGEQSYTVIGVAPPVLLPGWPTNLGTIRWGAEYQRLWVPLALSPQQQNRNSHLFAVLGRLAADASLPELAGATSQPHFITLLASYVPAHRASQVEPVTALRDL